MKTRHLSFILLLLPFAVLSQDCDCPSNLKWVRETFKANDAGFSYALSQKGQDAYEQHNRAYEAKVREVDNLQDCMHALENWLAFFRNGHIGIQPLNARHQESTGSPSEEDIRKSFADWEKLEVDVPAFLEYLDTKTTHDFEGVWVSGPYEIGVKKLADAYLGFIIKADGVHWTEGQVKLRIEADGSATYYMRDHSPEHFEAAELLGNNYLTMGFIDLKRKLPALPPDPEVELHVRSMFNDAPFFERVDDNTALLRIPSFSYSEKAAIDSVVLTNRELILQTPNLIIDLRDNGGGSDGSFQELLPILYTNPIRTVGVEFLSTPLNNQRMLDFIENDEYGLDKESKKWARKAYKKLSKQPGEFVLLNEQPVTETTFDTVHPFPQRIAILINENNGSTTEQFLLAAKQSTKVKLFGTTTAGVLDISNMHYVDAPCGEFQLAYSLSRSLRIPDMAIDDKGIQPDYYIGQDIPKYQWVDFAAERLAR
jgi:hypothetical protein